MDGINLLNSLLDETINSVLEDTADKFNLQQDSLKESDYQKYMNEDEEQLEVPWTSKYQTPQSDQSKYHAPKTQQTQYQYSRDEQPQYHKSSRSDQAQCPPDINRSQFPSPRTDKSQYQSPRKERRPEVDKPHLQYTRSDDTEYQVPKNDETPYQAPRSKQPQTQNTGRDPSRYPAQGEDQSQYQYSRKDQPPYQVPETGYSQHQAPRKDVYQNQYSKTIKPEVQRRPEIQQTGQKNYQNLGKTQNITPPFDDKTQKDSQESFQEKYERFRSQIKNLNQSSKKGSCQDLQREEERPESSSRQSFEDQQTTRHQVEEQPSSPIEETGAAEEPEAQQEIVKPQIVTRGMWGALPTLDSVPIIPTAADTVVFSFNTGMSPCDTPKECMRRVRETQAKHLGEGLADIQYSFLLGGDGYIYEGRGWGYESGAKREAGEGPNLNIGFIGNHKNDKITLPKHMVNNAQDLLLYSYSVGLLKGTKSREEVKELKK